MWYPKRSQYKYAKSRYRVRNWGDYETGLQRRGSLTVWLSDAALEARWSAHLFEPGHRGSADHPHDFPPPSPPDRRVPPVAGRSPGQRERNRNIRTMRKLGREEWYATSGYSRRSLVENAVFRYKTVLGPAMRSRSLVGQRIEASLACKILNTMTGLGMPDSVRVR